MSDYDELDPTFKQDLMASDRAVWIVARFLRYRGYSIILPPIRVRPTLEQINAYTDDSDIQAEKNGVGRFYDVKHRPKLRFTSTKDYPFDDVMLDTVRSWTHKKPKPIAYFIVNADCTGALVFATEDSDKWDTREKYMKGYQRRTTCVFAPPELGSYVLLGPQEKEEKIEMPGPDAPGSGGS
jgi:hypothetical protein